jgi:hypothetical protein
MRSTRLPLPGRQPEEGEQPCEIIPTARPNKIGGNAGRRLRLVFSPRRGSGKRRIGVDLTDPASEPERRQRQRVASKHPGRPALVSAPIDGDLSAIPADQQYAAAAWLGAMDLAFAVDDAVAGGQDIGHQMKASK